VLGLITPLKRNSVALPSRHLATLGVAMEQSDVEQLNSLAASHGR
jgi:hypothetical protein